MDILKFYIAGALFSDNERKYLEEIVNRLSENLKLDPYKNFYLPHRDSVNNKGRDTFDDDIKGLNSCNNVIAILDGSDVDSGTAVELGYAYAKGKKIFGLRTDKRKQINIMIEEGCSKIFRNLDEIKDEIKEEIKLLQNHQL